MASQQAVPVPVQGQTVAMYGVPFGTKLIVDDVVYTVEDRGTPYGHIDIYMVDHEAAAALVQEKQMCTLANDQVAGCCILKQSGRGQMCRRKSFAFLPAFFFLQSRLG